MLALVNPIGDKLSDETTVAVTHVDVRKSLPYARVQVWNGDISHTDVLFLDSAASRGRFIKSVMQVIPTIDKKELTYALLAQGEAMWKILNDLSGATTPRETAQIVEDIDTVESKALRVLLAGDPLDLVRAGVVGLGYGGDLMPATLTYLALTSRLLVLQPGDMPCHLMLRGASSSGKSFTVETVLNLFPANTYYKIDAGSPRVIIYLNIDLEHGALIYTEADSIPKGEDNPAASAVRNLLQENRLIYDVVERDPVSGQFGVRRIERPGPTVCLTTGLYQPEWQMRTRLFVLEMTKDKDGIAAALTSKGQIELHGPEQVDEALIAFQEYLQRKAPWNVVVPYIEALAEEMGSFPTAERVLRDFSKLKSLIKSVAVLRHRQRKIDDGTGRLVATLEDYATVYELVDQLYRENISGMPKRLQDTIRFIHDTPGASSAEVAEGLGVTPQTAGYHVNKAVKLGYLEDRNHEKSGNVKSLYAIAEPPEERGLPTPDELLRTFTQTYLARGQDVMGII